MKSTINLAKQAIILVCLLVLQVSTKAQSTNTVAEIDDTSLIKNADFETGNLSGWNYWRTSASAITTDAFSGKYGVKIGPERGFCMQEAKVRPNSLYRISAYVKTSSSTSGNIRFEQYGKNV